MLMTRLYQSEPREKQQETHRRIWGLKRARMCPYIVVHMTETPCKMPSAVLGCLYCCFRAELKETQRPAAFLNWKEFDDYWL